MLHTNFELYLLFLLLKLRIDLAEGQKVLILGGASLDAPLVLAIVDSVEELDLLVELAWSCLLWLRLELLLLKKWLVAVVSVRDCLFVIIECVLK